MKTLLLTCIALLTACRGPLAAKPDSRLAAVSIGELGESDYNRYQFAMKRPDGTYEVPLTYISVKGGNIERQVTTGTYRITLDYFQDQTLVWSADLCPDGVRNNEKTLQPGPNTLDITVCPAHQKPTFAVDGSRLIDPSGKPFVFRGINVPFAYFFDPSYAALDQVKRSGFNAVRIVWCADTYVDPNQRCQQKDQRPAADLDKVLTRLADLSLVAVLNLQNATGLNTDESLLKMAEYLVRDDIRAVLLKHQRHLIINIANEWMGDWAKTRAWVDGYRQVIPLLRKAGLPHVLVVDARGYGQDFSSIEESSAELLALDSQLLFSSHMYAVYNTEQIVAERLNFIRSHHLPYMIGEFGCSHYDDGTQKNRPVACEAIMREAANALQPIGTLAWSYSGNRREESDLDVFAASDWITPTAYGQKVIEGPYGVRATANQACFFDTTRCR